MAAVAHRAISAQPGNRPKSSGEDGKSLWSSLLESVATGKRLPEKTLLILGGTVETQKNFLDALASESSQRRRPAERLTARKPLVANRFALGYTYQDVLDGDQDDILARLSQYLLADSHPAFTPLLQPLFTRTSVPDLALTILLDWGEPWNWLRQLRDWIKAIRSTLASADDDVKDVLEENTKAWKERRRGPKHETATSHDYDASLPVSLGSGEWDEPLGVPLCVVCQNAEKIEILEREHGWKEYDFDTVLIYMRTVLLKHGGSLIYTASAAPGSLQTLLRSTLDIHSILQRNPLKHNVNDRDKVLVPPNWDSWGKIRPLREGFDFEGVSNGWSLDIQHTRTPNGNVPTSQDDATDEGAIASYEKLIKNPHQSGRDAATTESQPADGIEVRCESNQDFFARQLEALDKFKAEDELAAKKAKGTKDGKKGVAGTLSDPGRITDHIGPVQFNMGGIQVDADQMLQTLREREAGRSPVLDEASPFLASPDDKSGNESLRSFFASLASKGGSSATNSPRAPGK